MKLIAKVLQGDMCSIEVDPTESVLKIKHILEDKTKIPVAQQKVVFQGKPLGDFSTVGECGLKDGSRLFVVRQKGKDLVRGNNSASPTSITKAMSPEEQAWWAELRRFLLRHFTKENAELVLQEYKKDLDKTINSLNLDDIERFATAKLTG
ncbi:ubiquitin-like protein 4A, partial [Liolophura sinensis]|uniref:ubiquitin-like protein 4A n=1 Tax=Liolophura sinensis TaxID=3198878 RepID=UPI0031592ABA